MYVFILHVCLYNMCMPAACGGQKKASDPWNSWSCELLCRCWVPDLVPLEEHQALLITSPSLQPLKPLLCTQNTLNAHSAGL